MKKRSTTRKRVSSRPKPSAKGAAQLRRELRDAREQQAATADILHVISRSPSDIQPVFDAIVEHAARLCDALGSTAFRFDGRQQHFVAHFNVDPETVANLRKTYPQPPTPKNATGRAILDRIVVHVADVMKTPEYPGTRNTLGRSPYSWRSALAVPMLRGTDSLGAMIVVRGRGKPQPFSTNEIELLKTFADQAVIAIENARVFTELQEKNQQLTDAHGQVTQALEQQTATSEILRVISRSPTDVRPVLDAIVRSAVKLCDGLFSAAFLFDGRQIEMAAGHNFTPVGLAAMHQQWPRPAARDTITGLAVLERRVIHVRDVDTDPDLPPSSREVARAVGYRSLVAVPMIREGQCIGCINVSRPTSAFTDKQIELLKTFADQAVIAIENVRLFKELEARTQDLTRSVDKLSALGEVGQAVSSSLDLDTVLNTIVSRAVQLAGANAGTIWEYDNATEEFALRITQNVDDPGLLARREARLGKGEGAVGRLAVTLEPIQVPDITLEGAYDSRLRDALVGAGTRALLAVPLLREGRILGGLVMSRRSAGEFAPEVVDVLKTFATQSALAIQNARLFREIEQKSRELEVASRHKSEFLASMSHELRTPLNAIIGFSDVLLERMFGEINDKQAEYLDDILSSGKHLLSLINDILDLSKIEAGRMELDLAEFDLPGAIDNALTLVRERAMRRGIALEASVDQDLGDVRADERKVKQVLLNLLSNAVKFTPEGGRIAVNAGRADGMAEISVADTGIGIAPEDQEAVFEEFRQVGSADRKAEGTGLGLALCRKFVELHGGRIRVKSQLGAGATFTFTLPLRP